MPTNNLESSTHSEEIETLEFNTLEELRSLLHNEPPSTQAFTRIYEYLDPQKWPPELYGTALDYAQQHLKSWPYTTRTGSIYTDDAAPWKSPEVERLNLLRQLKVVPLYYVYPEFIHGLKESPHLANLKGIALNGLHGHHAIKALADNRHIVDLAELNLDSCYIGPTGIQTLADSNNFRNLTALDLEYNSLGLNDIITLCNSPLLTKLTILNLGHNSLTDSSIEILANSKNLASLESLSLRFNQIGPRGAAALARSPYLTNLNHLSLRSNGIGNEGAIALAQSPFLTNIDELNLADNGITDEGAIALAKSPYLSNKAKRTLKLSPEFYKHFKKFAPESNHENMDRDIDPSIISNLIKEKAKNTSDTI